MIEHPMFVVNMLTLVLVLTILILIVYHIVSLSGRDKRDAKLESKFALIDRAHTETLGRIEYLANKVDAMEGELSEWITHCKDTEIGRGRPLP